MDLAQETGEVIDILQGVRRHDQIYRTAGGESEIGNLALMTLHGHFGLLGLPTQQRDSVRRRIYRHGPCTCCSKCHSVARGPDAQLDDSFAGDVATQAKLAFVGY